MTHSHRIVPVLAFAVLATCTVSAFLGGCGGSESGDFATVPNSAVFLNQSYIGTATVDAGRVADVQVRTTPGSTATGSFTIRTRSAGVGRAVLATGTATGRINLQNGTFTLSGTYTNNGEPTPFTLVGILPSAATPSDFTLTVGGSAFTGRLVSATGVTPTPAPTVTPLPTPTPRPSVSPSPSVSPTPVPSPTPTGNPSSVVAKYYPLNTGDVYTYISTVNGVSSDITTRTGNLVTFRGNSAFRQEDLTAGGAVESVNYVNITSGGFAAYGFEELNASGAVTETGVFTPPFTIPASILSGNAGSFSYTSNITTSAGTSAITFRGTATPMGTESVTVPAGTFTALKVRLQITTTISVEGQTITTTGDSIEHLVENVGMVKSVTTATSSFGTTTVTEVLKSATVAGRRLP